MTLNEAIRHAEEKACGNTGCAEEHRQLAEWLKELKELRVQMSMCVKVRVSLETLVILE